jgi:hypothetical protein
MTIHETTESHLARIALALAGCTTHAQDMPAETETSRAALERQQTQIAALLEEHTRIRQSLVLMEERINAELRDAARTRAELLRMVESHFGSRDGRMRHFRPASEARLHAPRLRTATPTGQQPPVQS